MKYSIVKIKAVSLLLSVSMILFTSTGIAENVMRLEGCDPNKPAFKALIDNHPEIETETVSNIVYSTEELVGGLLSGEFNYDTFVMNSSAFDVNRLIEKGYCSSLESSAPIMSSVQQMYDPIQKMVMKNETAYGVPFYCYISYFRYSPEAWSAANLTKQDVPQSFEQLLDFLENWIERIKECPDEITVCVVNTFDEDHYGPHSYVSFLVDRLVANHIMQCNYAGEPIRFDTPLFRNILERCQQIGKALYEYEPQAKTEFGLFYDWQGMRGLECMIPLRITCEQPILIKANVFLAFSNIRTNYPNLASEYLENVLAYMKPEDAAYLYPDAEPVEDAEYMRSMNLLGSQLKILEDQYDTLNAADDPLAQLTLKDQIDDLKREYDKMANSEERYIISPNDLAMYHQYGEHLYFQAPSVFDPAREEGQTMRQLRDRFSQGNMPIDQFVKRVDTLAYMLESESQ